MRPACCTEVTFGVAGGARWAGQSIPVAYGIGQVKRARSGRHMPIIYMHGVNTRDPNHFTPIREYLRRIVAPAIAPDPENVSIEAADWFQFCPPPKYGGISRPRTILLAAGAEDPA